MEITEAEISRLATAYEKVRLELLNQRVSAGHWVGELSTSPLSTATAVSALALVQRRRLCSGTAEPQAGQQLDRLIIRGIAWLADHQKDDGGWGDTERSHSNVATTMLAVSAFHLTGVPAEHANLLTRADAYLDGAGRLAGLRRRYGRDKTFAVPILTNAALAGLVPWREVSALPFELACFPHSFYRFLRIPVVSYAIPALVAVGQARFFHRKPLNPITRLIRSLTRERSLEVLLRMQPDSGGYLEAVPLTSFVVMSLASIGQVDHPVARGGVDFLLDSVRQDGSWPIDTNLATWNTTLAWNALSSADEEITELASLDWLLSCQHTRRHPFTGADPGGWGWSDLSGAVPDADDTPGALLALAAWRGQPSCDRRDALRIDQAVGAGVRWLLDLQNGNGGWPTFCRGWGKLPFDRSGADLTAHAMRGLAAWRARGLVPDSEIDQALRDGLAYLGRVQRVDGSWVPLWFGHQDHSAEENPVYGTARVLLAYRDLNLMETNPARRGLMWLTRSQRADGGWSGASAGDDKETSRSSVEETAIAVEALASTRGSDAVETALHQGVVWLVDAVESGRFRESAPIGFYFAKLWYHEKLYPIIFTAAALGSALRRTTITGRKDPASTSLTC